MGKLHKMPDLEVSDREKPTLLFQDGTRNQAFEAM